jgi:non-specific serine/threonine protein kinase
LGVVGEQVYRVPSLESPAANWVGDPDSALRFHAVRLFEDRAQRVAEGFRVNSRNAGDVAEICRQLDGIPLAIEMAAARLRSLTAAEIRARLNDRFRLLKSGNKGALPRQQTLRAAIDWSYDQLSEPEQDLLRQLSVFAGGWTLEAAEGVAGTKMSKEDVEDLLSSLVDKSLVIAESRGERSRYRFLETVRQYAQYRLSETEESFGARKRHRDHFLTFAQDMRQKLLGADQAEWFDVMDDEHDNLRQAIVFCVEEPEQGECGLRLTAALSRFWMNRSHFAEGRERFTAVLNAPSAQVRTQSRAQALNGFGLLTWRLSDYHAAQAAYEESVSISREIGETLDVGRALNNLALIVRDQGDYVGAGKMHEESLAIFRQFDQKLPTAIALSNLGVIHHYQGEFEQARLCFEDGLRLQRELGDGSSAQVSLNSLGAVALNLKDKATARKYFQEGYDISCELADKYGCARHLFGLGCASEDPREGARIIQQSLLQMAELGERTMVTDHFSSLASFAREMGMLSEAATLFAARISLRETTGSPLPVYEKEGMDEEVALIKDSLGAAFDAAWNAGSRMTMDQAIEYARGLSI